MTLALTHVGVRTYASATACLLRRPQTCSSLLECLFRQFRTKSKNDRYPCYSRVKRPALGRKAGPGVWSQVAENGPGNDDPEAVLPGSGGGI